MPSHRRLPTLLIAAVAAAGFSQPGWCASDSILIYGPDTSIHVLDLPFSSADPVWIAGDSRVVPCTDPALESEDIPGLVAQAVEHIDALDYEAAKRLTDQAITAMPCAPGAVDRAALLDVYYFRGIAAFHLGDRDGARQNFQYALAIDREKTWDTDYPPEPQQVFLLAKEDAIGLDRVSLGIDLAGDQVSEFNFDGAAHAPESSHELSVIPGMHLVQYTAADTAYSRLVEVRPGGSAALVTRQGLTSAVISGPATGGMLPAARASLRALVQGRNLKRAYVVVVNEDDTGRIYLYDETYTTLAEAASVGGSGGSGGSAGGGGEAPPPTSASPGGLTLGLAGFALAHGSSYAGFNLRGHVRLVEGLELDLGGGMNVTSYQDEDGRVGVGMPYLRVGARYRFGSGVARPYVGAAFLMSLWNDLAQAVDGSTSSVRVSPGGVALLGLDLQLTSKVVLNIELPVGYSRSFWLAPQLGLGFRF